MTDCTHTPPHSQMQKLPLSAVLITYNAAHCLETALLSLQFCDEILVIDSNSTDNTAQKAEALGACVLQHAWEGFGPQKHWAVQQARHNWVLCLDADEQISHCLYEHIAAIWTPSNAHLLNNPHLIGFEFARSNHFMGRYLKHGEGYPDYSRRLFHRERAQWSFDLVHEKVMPTQQHGEWKTIKGDLLHHSAETLQTYLEKQNRYTNIQAQELFNRGKIPSKSKLILSPLIRFIKFYFIRKGFLDGVPGLIHIAIGCFNSFIKQAKCLELQAKQKKES